MSAIINDSLQNNSPKALDGKYGIFEFGVFRPFATISEANLTNVSAYRHKGLTVLIGSLEYWYKNGILDGDLVVKDSSLYSVDGTLLGNRTLLGNANVSSLNTLNFDQLGGYSVSCNTNTGDGAFQNISFTQSVDHVGTNMSGVWTTNRAGITGSVTLLGSTVALKSDNVAGTGGLSSITLSSGSGVSAIDCVADSYTISGKVRIGSSIPAFPRVFHITSTTTGIVISNLSTIQRNAVANPNISELIYNTSTNQFEYYNGTTWSGLATGASSVGGTNLGAGAQVYTSTIGTNLNFRSITEVLNTGIVVSQNTNDISIGLKDTVEVPAVQTLDDTPTAMFTISVPLKSSGIYEVTVIGSSPVDATAAVMGKKFIKYQKLSSGTINTLGLADAIIPTSLSSLTTADFDLIINGNDIDIQVTGELFTTLRWTAKIEKTINLLP